MNAKKVILLLVVAAIFGTLTSVVYGFVLPRFFPGPSLGAYLPLVLIVGVVIASLVGGYVGYRGPMAERTMDGRLGIGFRFAAITAVLTLFLSLFLILNTRGS
jgi:hypothetical protein